MRGRLWRKANPALPAEVRSAWVKSLMTARRTFKTSRANEERANARERVNEAKCALGERGPVWWTDGAPDFNRKLVKNTPYKDWFESLPDANISEHLRQ